MTNYSQVLELDEITLEDCLNLFKTGKIVGMKNKIANHFGYSFYEMFWE